MISVSLWTSQSGIIMSTNRLFQTCIYLTCFPVSLYTADTFCFMKQSACPLLFENLSDPNWSDPNLPPYAVMSTKTGAFICRLYFRQFHALNPYLYNNFTVSDELIFITSHAIGCPWGRVQRTCAWLDADVRWGKSYWKVGKDRHDEYMIGFFFQWTKINSKRLIYVYILCIFFVH